MNTTHRKLSLARKLGLILAASMLVLFASGATLFAPSPAMADEDLITTIFLPVVEVTYDVDDGPVGRPKADFNGDGFADLVIGSPFKAANDASNAGLINVLYGTVFGLTEANDQVWHQDVTGVDGSAESNDNFGLALEAADFNGDGFTDVAVGVPSEDEGDDRDTGVINVLYGSLNGLVEAGDQLWSQDSPDIGGSNETGDRFGDALTTGDFNNDGYQDLIIGAPTEDVGEEIDAGTVHLIIGSAIGLVSLGNAVWDQNANGVAGTAETDDRFGTSVAAGDFNGDGYDDLAVGAPEENLGDEADAGSVTILYGFGGGLTDVGAQQWEQAIDGIPGTRDDGDRFGDQVAAGDFNNDGYDDLAISATGEDIGNDDNAGEVTVLYGTPVGLTSIASFAWNQDTGSIGDDVDANDRFGRTLLVADFNGDGFADLAIGVPEEDVGDNDNAGGVNVIYGSTLGLTDVGNQFWTRDSAGIQGDPETEGQFGRAITAGDYNGDGFEDLAVGVPGEDVGSTANGGGVTIIYGSAIGLTANLNQRWNLDSAGVGGDPETDDFFGRALR